MLHYLQLVHYTAMKYCLGCTLMEGDVVMGMSLTYVKKAAKHFIADPSAISSDHHCINQARVLIMFIVILAFM